MMQAHINPNAYETKKIKKIKSFFFFVFYEDGKLNFQLVD